MILTAKLLSHVRHGFSTRLGGISTGAYASMNLGLDVDRRPHVLENRSRLEAAVRATDIVQVDQVHGSTILDAETASGEEADGLISTSRAIAVRTADCAPILIATDDGSIVAAIHAGWRGACARIAALAIDRFRALGRRPDELSFAIGPTIGVRAFEVGPEVIDAARASLGAEPPCSIGPRGRPHLDLVRLIEMQIEAAGGRADRIERVGGCTFENRAMFFSHRRDGGVTGRHMSVIAPGPST